MKRTCWTEDWSTTNTGYIYRGSDVIYGQWGNEIGVWTNGAWLFRLWMTP